jgi:hypothetical protein
MNSQDLQGHYNKVNKIFLYKLGFLKSSDFTLEDGGSKVLQNVNPTATLCSVTTQKIST